MNTLKNLRQTTLFIIKSNIKFDYRKMSSLLPRIPFTSDFFFRQLFDTTSSTYSYLLADINSCDAIIIDPVLEHAKRDAKLIEELGFNLKYASM